MKTRFKSNFLFYSFLLLFTTSCTSLNIIPVEKIKDPEAGKRALIITQDLRYHTMVSVKKLVNQGLRSSSDIEKFKKIDDKFRPAWDSAKYWLDQWILFNEGKTSFIEIYQQILDYILEMELLND